MLGGPEAAEWIEREAWRDLLAGAPPPTRADLAVATHEARSALVLTAARVDHVLFNRTLGLGVDEPADEQTLDAILARYHEAEVERFLIHLTAHAWPRALHHWLEARGIARSQRAWVKMIRGRSPVPPAHTDLSVRPAAPADADALGHMLAEGFSMPAEAARVWASSVGRPHGFHPYVACDGETPVAAALMYVRGDVANLVAASTLPSHRGRGAQGALLARRIVDALDLGARMLVAETGEKVPGDPQRSYRSLLRHGFRPSAVRESYAPIAAGRVRRTPTGSLLGGIRRPLHATQIAEAAAEGWG